MDRAWVLLRFVCRVDWERVSCEDVRPVNLGSVVRFQLRLPPMTVFARGLRPRTPSSFRSLAIAGPTVHSLRS